MATKGQHILHLFADLFSGSLFFVDSNPMKISQQNIFKKQKKTVGMTVECIKEDA